MKIEVLQPIKQQKLSYILYLYIYRDLETINPRLQGFRNLWAIQLQTYNLLKNLQVDNYWVWGPIIVDLETVKIMNEKRYYSL